MATRGTNLMNAKVERNDNLTETDLEELAYDLERARQIVQLKYRDEVNEQRREAAQSDSGCVPFPETSCLELAAEIISEAVGRLQTARKNI